MHRTHATFLVSAVATLLAACGGGGDDGGGATIPMPTAEFTSSNAPIIASAVVAAVTDSNGTIDEVIPMTWSALLG